MQQKDVSTSGIATRNAELVRGLDTFQISREYKAHRVHRVFFLPVVSRHVRILSCYKKTHWSVISVAKKKENKRIGLKSKESSFRPYNKHYHDIDFRAIAVICLFKSASILFKFFCCNGGRLYYFFLRRRRRKSGKTSAKNAGDSWETGTNISSRSYCRLL